MSDPKIQSAVNRHAVKDMANAPNASQARIVEIEGSSIRGAIKEWWDNLRIGDGHLAGMLRLGGHELTQALAAFPDSNIRPMDEPGVFGNATPQIITEEMGHHSYDQDLSIYAQRGGNDQTPFIER